MVATPLDDALLTGCLLGAAGLVVDFETVFFLAMGFSLLSFSSDELLAALNPTLHQSTRNKIRGQEWPENPVGYLSWLPFPLQAKSLRRVTETDPSY